MNCQLISSNFFSQLIDLEVHSLVTQGIGKSPEGIYMKFIGCDSTGKIRCSMLEPHCLQLAGAIRVSGSMNFSKFLMISFNT